MCPVAWCVGLLPVVIVFYLYPVPWLKPVDKKRGMPLSLQTPKASSRRASLLGRKRSGKAGSGLLQKGCSLVKGFLLQIPKDFFKDFVRFFLTGSTVFCKVSDN